MISSSSASAREWLQQYEVFKKKVIATRGSGDVFSNQELKGLSSAISSLELQLRGTTITISIRISINIIINN